MIKSPNRAAQEMYKPDPGIPFLLLLHLHAVDRAAEDTRIAVGAVLISRAEAHPVEIAAVLEVHAAVHMPLRHADLDAVDVLPVNAGVAVRTGAAVPDLRQPPALRRVHAVVDVAVLRVDLEALQCGAVDARIAVRPVAAVDDLRLPRFLRVRLIRQVAGVARGLVRFGARQVGVEVRLRVHARVGLVPHLKVQVRAVGVAGVAHVAELLALLDRLPVLHGNIVHVRVQRAPAVRVAQLYGVAVGAVAAAALIVRDAGLAPDDRAVGMRGDRVELVRLLDEIAPAVPRVTVVLRDLVAAGREHPAVFVCHSFTPLTIPYYSFLPLLAPSSSVPRSRLRSFVRTGMPGTPISARFSRIEINSFTMSQIATSMPQNISMCRSMPACASAPVSR